MGVPLAQVLGAKNLINVIQGIKPGLREKTLPPALLTPTEKKSGNYGTYHKVVGERRAAKVMNYGAPAIAYEPTGVAEVPVNFLHSFEFMSIKPDAMMNLLVEGDEVRQKLGMQTIARQTKDFALTFRNLRVAAIFQMLAHGALTFDANGRITTTSSVLNRTLSYGIPATNLNQLAIPRYNNLGKVVASPIVSADWSTTSTNILQQLQDLRMAAVQLTGYDLKHAFCGSNIKSYLFNNTAYSNYLKHNPVSQEALIKNRIVDGFADLAWHEMTESFISQDNYNPGNVLSPNAAMPVFGPDVVCFTPEIDDGWYDLIEGSYPVPAVNFEGENGTDLLDKFIETFGHFGWAQRGMANNPAVIVEYQGDTFLPVIRVPYAIFIAQVANYSTGTSQI